MRDCIMPAAKSKDTLEEPVGKWADAALCINVDKYK